MILKLGFGETCAVKELELAHEELVNHTSPNERDIQTYALTETVRLLNFRVRCMCHDVRCNWWDRGACRCNGALNCLHIGFEIRNTDEINLITDGETETAKRQIPQDHLERQPNEAFIVWKVRVAYEVYQRASEIHNMPEDGIVQYRYENWREEPIDERRNNFERTVNDVRGIGVERHGNMSQVVGCFSCGRIFENETYLNAHVDLHRYREEVDHTFAQIVTPISVSSVRATPPDYRPPIPVVAPTPTPTRRPRAIHRSPIRIDQIDRESDESDDHFREAVANFVEDIRGGDGDRGEFPEAVGCSLCGAVYTTESDYFAHAVDDHVLTLSESERYEVNP